MIAITAKQARRQAKRWRSRSMVAIRRNGDGLASLFLLSLQATSTMHIPVITLALATLLTLVVAFTALWQQLPFILHGVVMVSCQAPASSDASSADPVRLLSSLPERTLLAR